MLPVERLAHQRHDGRASPAEQERVDRHAGRVVPLGRDHRALGGRDAKARVRVRGRARRRGRPVAALPVDQVARHVVGHALPPDVPVVGQCAVCEDRVAVDRVHRVGVRLLARAGRHAEEPRLGVDRVEAAVGAELHPRDVVADRLDLPPRQGRDQHRQIGLATRRRERGSDVLDRALRRRELEDQHVLGQPTLVTGHHRRDPQREALLAQQRVTAVARAERPDLPRLGEMDDVLVLGVARPRHIPGAVAERHPDRMHARHELAVISERLQRGLPHPGHDPHRARDVRRVGQLHADVGLIRPDRAHRERHHVHRAAQHRAVEQLGQRPAHLLGLAPVVRRAGIGLVLRADERAILDPRDVVGV